MGTITTTFVKRINNVIEYKGTLTAIFKVGERGPQGEPGPGVAIGGTTGQVLTKASDSDYDTQWVNVSSGGTSEFTYITSYIIMLDDNGTTNITEMITAADFLQVCQDLVAGKNLLLRTLDTDLGLNITISPVSYQCSVNSDSASLVIYCYTDTKEYALITINLDRTNSTLSYTKETTVLQ